MGLITVLLQSEFPKKLYLPVGQVKNTVHQPNHEIQYPRPIAWTLLCQLSLQTNLPDEINYKYLYWIKLCALCCHFCINNTGMIVKGLNPGDISKVC